MVLSALDLTIRRAPLVSYLDGTFLDDDDVRIPARDRGFLFGDGVYEVVLCVGGREVAGDRHWRRLRRNLGILRIETGTDFDTLGAELAARTAEHPYGLVYLQVTRGAAPRVHAFPEDARATVYGFTRPFAWPTVATGAAIRQEDLRGRLCHVKTVNLLPNVLAAQAANEAGVAEALLVRDGRVTEGSSTNVFGVRNGTVHTHPLDEHILPGITRELLLELCAERGVPVVERAMPETLEGFDEIFVTSTSKPVLGITHVDGSPVGDGGLGEVTATLREAFRERVHADGFDMAPERRRTG